MSEEDQQNTETGGEAGIQQTANDNQGGGQSFAIPEAYRERGWTENLKSMDDVWQKLDNAQSLIGKRIAVPEWDKATPEEINKFYDNLRPKDISGYQIDESIPEGERESYSKIFYEAGLAPDQAKNVQDRVLALAKEKYESDRSEDGYKALAKETLGDKYEDVVKSSTEHLRKVLSEDQQKVLDNLPNDAAVTVFKLVDELVKGYKMTEGDAGSHKDDAGAEGDPKEALAKIDKELQALSRNPSHTQKQRSELVQKRMKVLAKMGENNG